MRSRYQRALLVAALAVAGAAGQEPTEKKVPTPAAEPNAVEVRFADDSVVKMVLQDGSIPVSTRYGRLMIPVGEVRRIDFGLHTDADTAKRIDTAVARLASRDFKLRDAATAELIALRAQSLPALQQAAKSTDLEVSRRAQEALKVLADTVPAEKLHLSKHDTVVTLDFTVIGKIETETLKARTPYFGEASLKLAEMRSLRAVGAEREVKVTVDAGKYGGQQEAWLASDLEVRSGTPLVIVAGGRVDLQPDDPGTMTAGPDGQSSRSSRDGRGFGGGPGGAGFGGRTVPRTAGTATPGTLLGRIGESGRVFVVGSRYEGTAGEEGKLYLRIVPSPTGGASSGNFDVKVTSGR
jgi:hypothetical protein